MLRREHVGRCWDCRHQRQTGNRRGSIFYFCGRSRTDARYPKYPPLPVLECNGYEAREADGWEQYAQSDESP